MEYDQIDEELEEHEPLEGELRVVNLTRDGQHVVDIERLTDGEWVSFEDIAANEN